MIHFPLDATAPAVDLSAAQVAGMDDQLAAMEQEERDLIEQRREEERDYFGDREEA